MWAGCYSRVQIEKQAQKMTTSLKSIWHLVAHLRNPHNIFFSFGIFSISDAAIRSHTITVILQLSLPLRIGNLRAIRPADLMQISNPQETVIPISSETVPNLNKHLWSKQMLRFICWNKVRSCFALQLKLLLKKKTFKYINYKILEVNWS